MRPWPRRFHTRRPAKNLKWSRKPFWLTVFCHPIALHVNLETMGRNMSGSWKEAGKAFEKLFRCDEKSNLCYNPQSFQHVPALRHAEKPNVSSQGALLFLKARAKPCFGSDCGRISAGSCCHSARTSMSQVLGWWGLALAVFEVFDGAEVRTPCCESKTKTPVLHSQQSEWEKEWFIKEKLISLSFSMWLSS